MDKKTLSQVLAVLERLEPMQDEPLFDDLNLLYTYQKKAECDNAIRESMRSYTELLHKEVPCGLSSDLYERIIHFFENYTAKLGVDIRPSLLGSGEGSPLLHCKDASPRDASGYRRGEDVFFRIELRQKETDLLYPCDRFAYRYEIDGVDGAYEGVADGRSGVFTLTVPREQIAASRTLTAGKGALIKLEVTPLSEREVLSVEGNHGHGYCGGAVVEFERVSAAKECPHDFTEFWQGQIARMLAVSPIDEERPSETTRYQSAGEHPDITLAYDIDLTNYFKIEKLTPKIQAEYRRLGINSASDEEFSAFDIFELSLKAPGPCPVTGILSIAKGLDKNAPAHLFFTGYSAHAAWVSSVPNGIGFSLTHHGYECRKPENPYYSDLNGNGILGSYGRENGRPNSSYTHPDDCYLLYLLLRNLQALRFLTDCGSQNPDALENETLAELCRCLQAAWNGEVTCSGGSMGGYQALTITALARLLGIRFRHSVASCPAFCGLSGHAAGGRINNLFGLGYTENMDYFDAVCFASLIDTPVDIPICGLGDYICPPSGVIATYHALRGPKSILLYQNSQHGYTATREVEGNRVALCPIYEHREPKEACGSQSSDC